MASTSNRPIGGRARKPRHPVTLNGGWAPARAGDMVAALPMGRAAATLQNVAPNRVNPVITAGTYSWGQIFGGPAIVTDGSTGYAQMSLASVPRADLSASGGDYTIALWVQAASFEAWGGVFCITNNSGNTKISLQRNDTTTSLVVFHSNVAIDFTTGITTTDLLAGYPRHIILSRVGTTNRSWLDGKFVSSNTDATDPASGIGDLIIGGDRAATANAAVTVGSFCYWDQQIITNDSIAWALYDPRTRWNWLTARSRRVDTDVVASTGQPITKRYSGVPFMRRGGTTFGQGWLGQ